MKHGYIRKVRNKEDPKCHPTLERIRNIKKASSISHASQKGSSQLNELHDICVMNTLG